MCIIPTIRTFGYFLPKTPKSCGCVCVSHTNNSVWGGGGRGGGHYHAVRRLLECMKTSPIVRSTCEAAAGSDENGHGKSSLRLAHAARLCPHSSSQLDHRGLAPRCGRQCHPSALRLSGDISHDISTGCANLDPGSVTGTWFNSGRDMIPGRGASCHWRERSAQPTHCTTLTCPAIASAKQDQLGRRAWVPSGTERWPSE